MIRFTKLVLAVALGSTAIGGAAYAAQDQAQPAAPPSGMHLRMHRHGDMLTRLDANHDGVITREEATTAADARFDRLDANHDGKIDQTELQGRRSRMMHRLDADGDGAVTKSEVEASAMRQFDRFDTNHDGKLDQAEIAAATAQAQQHMQDRRARWQAHQGASANSSSAPSDDQ